MAFGLWDSWESDALVLDRAEGIYADPDKVRRLNHVGRWFRSRGPLNIPRSPQGRPVIIQAGSSGRGRTFATRWSEVIFALQPNIQRMIKFRADVDEALDAQHRPRSATRVLMSVMPFVGQSRSEATEARDLHDSLVNPLVGLSTLAGHANADLSTLSLDADVEQVQASGSQGNLAALKSIAGGRPLTIAEAGRSVMCPRLVGTPGDIADELSDILQSGATDGFVISPAFLPETFADFVDHVVPILQRRKLLRTEYTGTTLREHLAEEYAE